jgi:site-specific recombinase XerD
MPTFDYGARIEKIIETIETSPEINQENKRLASDFKRDLKLDGGVSDARIQKVLSHLKVVLDHLGDTPLDSMEKDDIKDLVEWVHNRDISEVTKSDYRQVIKQFYKWLDGSEDDYPDSVDWIKTTSPNGNGTLPKDLLTREDINALKDGCRNARDRAFIALLYESGARIGELIDLTVGDIEDHQHGKKVVIDGKTGQRRLPLLESTPALNKWLNEHPDPSKDAPLWSQLRDGSKQLSYIYLRKKVLERNRERAGIEKPVNPHHFRHSRATDLANKFKEAQLCEWFGWVQGSKVPGKYVHLSGRDIDNAYTELHGLRPKEEEEEERPVVECPRCEELNETESRFCARCGQALDIDSADEVEIVQEQAEDLIVEVESKSEARIIQEILKTIREEPEEFLKNYNEW